MSELADKELEELEELDRLNKGAGDYNFQIDKRNRYDDLMGKIIAEIRRLLASEAECVSLLRRFLAIENGDGVDSPDMLAKEVRAMLAKHGKAK